MGYLDAPINYLTTHRNGEWVTTKRYDAIYRSLTYGGGGEHSPLCMSEPEPEGQDFEFLCAVRDRVRNQEQLDDDVPGYWD